MAGISTSMYGQLRETLLDCGPFADDRQLSALFKHPKLKPWRHSVPQAHTPAARVEAMLAFLLEKRRADTGENALVLLLQVLSERLDPADECHWQLARLAEELNRALAGASPPARPEEEANPQDEPMTFIAVDEKILACARSVARVSVPRIVDRRLERLPTGTGWLVTPELAFTCWHVVQARGFYDTPINEADLQAQVGNMLFTFDRRLPGEGIEHGVAALEHYDPDLDYALLRLQDRQDAPLSQRGFLALDEEAPLTLQTQLFVIQHPRGQPQQRAAGFFVKKHPTNAHRILHRAPTEQGTSGAPVLNAANWRVVALHNGENQTERLREGTLLKAILADLAQRRPDLSREIMAAQNAKE
jgi:hypothetical protein